MPKCPLCPAEIWPFQEQVLYKREEHHQRRTRAHLACYLRKRFSLPATSECFITDSFRIKPNGFCSFCRCPKLTFRSSRSETEICADCAKIASKLFEQTIADNQEEIACFAAGES